MNEKVICDTNIISRYLIGKNPEIITTIEKIGIENVYITPVIRIELLNWTCLYDGLDTQTRKLFRKIIYMFPLIHLNENISKLAVELSEKKPHSKPMDTLIGATVLYYNLKIYTMNKKDFKLIGVPLY